MSNYRADWTASFFDDYGIREWDRLTATPADEVSLYIHTYYLRKHVGSGWRVLEIGAGAGRFTQILASIGATVTVGDISSVQLELNRRHAREYDFAPAVQSWQQIDICDMSRFDDSSFDAVVAYGGPFSYVLDRRDVALAECIRLLKPNGKLLLSVMSLWGSAHRHLDGVLALPIENNRRITKTGDLLPDTQGDSGHYCHMFRAGELRDWLQGACLTALDLSASNCLSLRWDKELAELHSDEKKWRELLRMELEVCAEDGCVGLGTHLIAAAQL